MTRSRKTSGAIAAAVLLALPAASAQAAGSVSVLSLQFNEAAGATVARDASGLSHNGTIGSHVTMNGAFADWDRHSPTEGIAHGYNHLVTIPDAPDGTLDPDRGVFTVELRYKTRENFGNVIQKGQSTTIGGQVKLQQPRGKMSCMFKTPQGTATATSGAMLLNDDQWHTVRCERTPTSVTMYVDGKFVGRSNKPTGALNNTKPWTIGGKSECNAVTVTCDYFAGEIDYVKMTKG